MSVKRSIVAAALISAVLGTGPIACEKHPPPVETPTTRIASARFVPVSDASLPNARRVTEKLYAGGQPEGDAGFTKLQSLGVKTIISVDGSTPDVELAHKHGMKYVHLPFGYGTVPDDRGREIAKAIDEMPGPIYLHCHHGKHRSAAAVAVACVFNGSIPPSEAEDVLNTFGTGANYKGLWKSAREATPQDPRELRELKVTFVEKAKLPEMAQMMVEVDHHFDYLKLIQKAKWQTPQDHPDLDPPHEALQLQELFVELGRSEPVKSEPVPFHEHLGAMQKNVDALRAALASSPPDLGAADAAFTQAANSCANCHKAYRD